jgi:F420-dependent oxidoreductase-like protein
MRVSITITNYTWPGGPRALGGTLADVAAAADAAGVDTVWVADHVLQKDPTAGADTEMLESCTALGFLAARTERVRLGAMVAAATFRPPSLLLKSVTTLDVLSGGRAWLGIGAGYQAEEARAMDLPLPPTAERFEHLEDTLRMARHLWSGDQEPFTGTHHTLEAPVDSPPPISAPHPPVLVGGTGERRTLRLVAEYADACNVFDIPDGGATVRRKLDVLRGHCEAVGRPYEDVEKTLSTRFDPERPVGEFVEHCREAAGWGIEHVVVLAAGRWTPSAVEALAPAVPELAGA